MATGRGDIFDEVRREERTAFRRHHRGMIIQPGALGDCILTLPLADFLAEALDLESIDLVGHSEYIGLFPGRSCIGRIRSIDAIELHRLFGPHAEFDLEEHDPLVSAFVDYDWVTTFLGGDGTDFEQNLIYTANCSSGTDVTSIELKPGDKCDCHVSEFYIRQFVERNADLPRPAKVDLNRRFLIASRDDLAIGRKILADSGVPAGLPAAMIHPGSGGSCKNWPLENFLGTAKELEKLGVSPVFLLGPAEIESMEREEIELIEQAGACLSGLHLREVYAAMSCCGAYLGNDSGISHLAGAMGLPTIAMFSTTPPRLYRPLGPCATTRYLPPDDFAQVNEPLRRDIAGEIAKSAGS